MSKPDFDRMTKDEILEWFETTDDVSPIFDGMQPATEEVRRSSTPPMLLASIRLPVSMVEEIDRFAEADGVSRSDLIRDALTAFIADRTKVVSRDEADEALELLRRIVHERTEPRAEAA